jgi:argininosuccinate lyase
VRKALEQNKKVTDIDSSFLDLAAREYIGEPLALGDDEIRRVLDPLRAVKARTLVGGTAPAEVQRQIDHCYGLLRQDAAALAEKRKKLDEAAVKLEAAIDVILKTD